MRRIPLIVFYCLYSCFHIRAQHADLHWGCEGIDSADFANMEQSVLEGYEWIHPFCINDTSLMRWTVVLAKSNDYQVLATNSIGLAINVYDAQTGNILVSNNQGGGYVAAILFNTDKTGVYTFELRLDSILENRVGGAILAFSQKPMFDIVKKDYIHDGQILQRVFVVIPEERAADLNFLSDVACAVKDSCASNPPRNISFFREKEYANYKDNIFERDGEWVEDGISYDDWCNSYYLGEYNVESSEYISYPASYTKRGKVANLKVCP